MKHGKKPTREQRKFIEQFFSAADWLVVKDTSEKMLIAHRYSDKTTRILPKVRD